MRNGKAVANRRRIENHFGITSMRRATIAALLMATFVLGGCNTVRGVGDDLKSVANAVDDET